MDNVDDVLGDNVYAREQIERTKAIAAAAYEERIVKKILIKTGLGDQVKQMLFDVKEKTGKYGLNFNWFYEEYPSFPIWLSMRRLPFVHQLLVPDLFNKFTSLKFYSAWEDLVGESPTEDKPVGLIFDWPGVKGTQLVIHNYGVNMDVNQTRITRRIGKGANAQLVYVEQFEPFFDHVLDHWVP